MPARWALLCLLLTPTESLGAATWAVFMAGRPEVLVAARSLTSDGVPIINVSALAPTLDLTVLTRGGQIVLRTRRGREWQADDGASALIELPHAARTLPAGVSINARDLDLPLTVLAELCDNELLLDPAGRAFLFPRAAPEVSETPPSLAAAGWEVVQVQKSAAELEGSRGVDRATNEAASAKIPEVLPPRHESVNVQAGIGSVAGRDWAGEMDATGTIAGLRTTGYVFATVGRHGVEYRNASVLIQPRKDGWSLQAGDLLSELRGIARGVRGTWGADRVWRHGLSVERHDEGLRARWLAAYRSEVVLSSVLAGAEAASDGSVFVKARYAPGRAVLDGFWRHDRVRRVREVGSLASYDLWGGVSAGAGVRVSSTGEHSYLGGLSVRLQRFGSFSLQQTRVVRDDNSQTLTAVAASLPLGPMRLFQRFGWSDLSLGNQQAGLRTTNQQLQSMASYAPTSRLQFSYQSVTQWYPGGTASVWDEVTASAQLGSSTSLYTATAVPRVTDLERFRVRVVQTLGANTSLSFEFGQIPTFQPAPTDDVRPRLLVMLRRGFGMRTPVRGGDVSGRVLDHAGKPVAYAPVRLGDYITLTDTDGAYRLRKVPDGRYALAVDETHLAANYTASERVDLTMSSSKSQRVDLRVIPLNAIRGRVYLDRNRNGRFDPGEEVSGVVVALDQHLTMTDHEGRYGFYNLAPGRYVVRIDRARLQSNMEPLASSEAEVSLTPDGPALGIDFALRSRVKPVLMQEGR